MSKKITNNDVIQEVKDQEVNEVAVRDAEKPAEPETTEVTKEESKVPFHKKKAFKVIAAVGAGLGGVIVVGAKVISSFGKKKWDEGYEEGYSNATQETRPYPEETLEIEAQEEYPEEDE